MYHILRKADLDGIRLERISGCIYMDSHRNLPFNFGLAAVQSVKLNCGVANRKLYAIIEILQAQTN